MGCGCPTSTPLGLGLMLSGITLMVVPSFYPKAGFLFYIGLAAVAAAYIIPFLIGGSCTIK